MENHIDLIVTFAGSIIGWMLLQHFQHAKKIQAIENNQQNVALSVQTAMGSFKELKEALEKLTLKIDSYMYAEKEAFKRVVEENTSALKQIARK
jgi:uncharacterized protein YlxW (UPF0749 family)